MGTRNSSGVERRRVLLDGNRPRTHPNHPGRMATKSRPASVERNERLKDGDLLACLARERAGRAPIDARVDRQGKRIGVQP